MIQPLIKALFGDSDAAADADTVKGILLYEVVCAGSADTQDVLDFINRIGSFIKLACGCSQSFFCTLIHSSDSFFKHLCSLLGILSVFICCGAGLLFKLLHSQTNAIQREIARSRLLQSADQSDQGCLTSAVLSHEAIDRAFGNVHGKTVQSLKVFILFCQAVCLQNIVHSVLPPLMTQVYKTKVKKVVKKNVKISSRFLISHYIHM